MKIIVALVFVALASLVYASAGPSDNICGWTTNVYFDGTEDYVLSMDGLGDAYVASGGNPYTPANVIFSRKWQGSPIFQNHVVFGENWAYCTGQTHYEPWCGDFRSYISPYWYSLGSGDVTSINGYCPNQLLPLARKVFPRGDSSSEDFNTYRRAKESEQFSVRQEDGAIEFSSGNGESKKLLRTSRKLTAVHSTETEEGLPVIGFTLDNGPLSVLHCADSTCASASLVNTDLQVGNEFSVFPGDKLTVATPEELHTFSSSHGSVAPLACIADFAGRTMVIDGEVHACSASDDHPSYSKLYKWTSLASPLHQLL